MGHQGTCALCGVEIQAHGHYLVRMEIFADPSMPGITGDELDERDFDAELSDILSQIEGMSEDEMQDQVHRKFEYVLCLECHRKFLANPLGKPRERRDTAN